MSFLIDQKKAIVAGLAGEAVGGAVPEKYKTIAETATELPFMLEKPTKPLGSLLKGEEKAFATLAEKHGLNEKEITPLIQGEGKNSILKWLTRGGKELTTSGENIGVKLIKAKDKVLGSLFPGYTKGGVEGVEKYADDLYSQMVKNAEKYSKVKVNPLGVRQAVARARNKLAKQAGKSTQEEAALSYLEKLHVDLSSRKYSMSELMDIYRSINRKIGKGEMHLEDAAIAPIKKNIKNQIGRYKVANREIGKKMLGQFEEATLAYKKANDFKRINKKLSPIFTDEGANFEKLDKTLSQPVNKSLFNNVLGNEATSTLKEIAELGRKNEEVMNYFQKADPSFISKEGLTGFVALLNLKFGGMLSAGKTVLTLGASNWLGKQMLMNPKYQKLWKRMAEASLNGKWNIAKNLSEKIIREADREYQESED